MAGRPRHRGISHRHWYSGKRAGVRPLRKPAERRLCRGHRPPRSNASADAAAINIVIAVDLVIAGIEAGWPHAEAFAGLALGVEIPRVLPGPRPRCHRPRQNRQATVRQSYVDACSLFPPVIAAYPSPTRRLSLTVTSKICIT